MKALAFAVRRALALKSCDPHGAAPALALESCDPHGAAPARGFARAPEA